MAQATAAGASTPEQLVDVLTLALAGELHQTELGELGDLRPGGVVAHSLGEVLKQLQLIAARLHVDEVDDHHAANVAELELAGDLDGRLTVGPEHRLAGIGGAGERTGVDIDDGERLSGLDDHVAPGRQIHPRLEGIANGGVDLEVLQDLGRLGVGLHQHVGVVGAQEGIGPGNRFGGVHHDPHQLRTVEIAQHAMHEVFVAVEQHRWAGALSRGLDALPLAQQAFEVVDQQLFTDPLGFGANQQTRARRLDQHPERPQAVALVFAVDPAGDVDALAVGLQHQKTPRQGEVAGEPGTLGTRGLLHHLHQHLLAGLQQLSDAGGPLAQSQGA